MPFVNNNRGDDEDDTSREAAGAPPVDWDPNDPDVVKVHYDVSAWTFDQRAELSEALAESGLPHIWEGEELVVPETSEGPTDALFDELELALGPFPVGLAADEESTEFGLDEWPPADRELLEQSLVDAQVPHRWQGTTVIVARDAEDAVDDLLDAIESGEVAPLDDEGAGAPDEAFQRLFTAADRLARDPADSAGRTTLLDLVPQLDERHPPFGISVRVWRSTVAKAQALVSDFESGPHDPSDVIGHAQELRTVARPFV